MAENAWIRLVFYFQPWNLVRHFRAVHFPDIILLSVTFLCCKFITTCHCCKNRIISGLFFPVQQCGCPGSWNTQCLVAREFIFNINVTSRLLRGCSIIRRSTNGSTRTFLVGGSNPTQANPTHGWTQPTSMSDRYRLQFIHPRHRRPCRHNPQLLQTQRHYNCR